MKIPRNISTLTFILLVIFSCSWAASADGHEHDDFLECLSEKFQNYSSISKNVYTQNNSSYTSILQFSVWNKRFMSDSYRKPLVIITPEHESEIPPIIYCAKESDLEIRTRSGGHDYEGLSYVAHVPFVIVDLIKLSDIQIDVEEKTVWVQAGAILASLYYSLYKKSPTLGFPASACPTVGLGGHISGGGYGTLSRKYGLIADNVIDARIVDVHGRILDRKSMGEDLFWAIRGGGGASFGVIVAWKIQLVDVPEKVTVFTVNRTLEQNATQIIHRWQSVAPRLDNDLFIAVRVMRENSNKGGRNLKIHTSYFALFLGGVDRLLRLMQEKFPELGLVREDCSEVSWIQSVLYIAAFPIGTSPEVLRERFHPTARNLKFKSDFVQTPIPEYALEGIWRKFYEPEAKLAELELVAYGGKMDEISESATPFPHRAGNLYKLQYYMFWPEEEAQNGDRYIGWTRELYSYTAPYVSKNPRAAYFNYRDLDIGANNKQGKTSYAQASIWGKKYFKNNFDRLVQVKTIVDPENFFRNEQSIPPLH